jgi:hypothetical protein
MKIKYTYDQESEVPATLKDFYTEKDGKWTLDTEETLFPKIKVDQFRDDAIGEDIKFKEKGQPTDFESAKRLAQPLGKIMNRSHHAPFARELAAFNNQSLTRSPIP